MGMASEARGNGGIGEEEEEEEEGGGEAVFEVGEAEGRRAGEAVSPSPETLSPAPPHSLQHRAGGCRRLSPQPGQVRCVPEAALRAALSSLAHPGAPSFAAVRCLILSESDPAKPRPGERLSTRCESVTSSAASPKLLVRDHHLMTSLSWGLPRSKSATTRKGSGVPNQH
ncbi:hypothetical protein Droror1_Dr00025337 [Drosera rotundifolia]